MNKKEVLNEINKAKNAHVLWFSNALALSLGTDPGESSVPKKHTECAFGKWYYGAGQENKDLESFKKIESIHKLLHDKYNEIFKKYEELSGEGFFENIELRDSEQQKEFNDSIDELKEISKRLLVILSDLENALK